MIDILLMEIEHPGNLGAIARVMANFNLKNLTLINPKCSPKDEEARNRAKHAQNILKKAKIVKKIPNYDYIVATTAKLGKDYNIPRSPLTVKEFAEKIKGIKKNSKTKIALLIGREGIGLTNKEVLAADFVVTIPSHKKYPTLNISQACTILFYELFQTIGKDKNTDPFNPITKKEKDLLLKNIDEIIDKVEFSTKGKKETQHKVWKRLINKAMLTKREAFAVFGLLKKLK
jgi:tRNA/rRNA methyltransferase